jgi:hypothetical protein
MDHNFWLERWQKQEIGFHQLSVQPALQKFWPRLGVARNATVLVPLAGKTLDMAWLAEQGHTSPASNSERAVMNLPSADAGRAECGQLHRQDGCECHALVRRFLSARSG